VLTKQYELAKVEEAKEIPSIKILDAPTVPESRSWPPRVFILVFGTLISIAVACLWVLGKAWYDSMASNDPRRALVHRLFSPVARQRPQITSGSHSNP
jgi:LPS O-antigen subunit length determinant protein (WzzB/FepE family)